MGEVLVDGVFMGSHRTRSSAAGEIPASAKALWEQEESDRGCSEEASIAPSMGVVESRTVCAWGSGVTLLGAL